jgi:hypothetical protein
MPVRFPLSNRGPETCASPATAGNWPRRTWFADYFPSARRMKICRSIPAPGREGSVRTPPQEIALKIGVK